MGSKGVLGGGRWPGDLACGGWPGGGRGQYGGGEMGVLRNIFNCITTSTSAFHCFTK